MKFQSKYKTFIHENASENIICEMVAILFLFFILFIIFVQRMMS